MSEVKITDEIAEYCSAVANLPPNGIRSVLADSPRHIPGCISSTLDMMLGGGFRCGKMYVLASAPGMGKTTLALQLALSISAHGNDVLYVSLDEDAHTLTLKGVSCCSRMISEEDALTMWQLRDADREDCIQTLTKWQLVTLEQAWESYAVQAARLKFIDRPTSMDELERIVSTHKRLTGNTPFVILDSLKLLRQSENQRGLSLSDQDRENVARLKSLAVQRQLPLLVLSSVNFASYYVGVSLESLKHAGSIEHTADVVLVLHPWKCIPMAETMAKDVREMTLSCVKNREGVLGNAELRYHAAYNFFFEE